MSIRADVAILGAGPGGYVAAIRAARLGARVVVTVAPGVGYSQGHELEGQVAMTDYTESSSIIGTRFVKDDNLSRP